MAEFDAASPRQYPRKVTRLLNSMKKAQKRINELRENLRDAESEYNRLDIEWKEYKASIAPIRNCPNEILSIIFHFYLLENPRLVRRLLLVCKKWYAITVNDPRMWNRIMVTIPDEWDIKSAAPPIKRRIKRCLERSGTLLLDLTLDLSQLRSAEDQIREKIRMCFIHNVSEEDWDVIWDWAGYLDIGELLKSPTTTRYLPKHMLAAIQQLIGNKGETMSRWGAVKIDFPESDMPFMMDIWQMFSRPAPNLNSMVIRCSEMMEEYPDELTVGFPDVPSLKHLDIDELEDLSFLPLERSELESLVVHNGARALKSLCLPRFLHLQRLEISGRYRKDNDLESWSLTLPRLSHLVLRGDVENLDTVDFQIPILRTLDLVRWHDRGFTPLPRVQSLHVRWILEKDFEEYWSPSTLLADMKRILELYSLAANFTVDEFGSHAFIEVVRSLQVDGGAQSALESIVIKRAEGKEETILVSSLS